MCSMMQDLLCRANEQGQFRANQQTSKVTLRFITGDSFTTTCRVSACARPRSNLRVHRGQLCPASCLRRGRPCPPPLLPCVQLARAFRLLYLRRDAVAPVFRGTRTNRRPATYKEHKRSDLKAQRIDARPTRTVHL